MLTDRNQYFTDKSNLAVKGLPIKIKSKLIEDQTATIRDHKDQIQELTEVV